MQTKSFFTKTRWLVTIILTAFSIGQMWAGVDSSTLSSNSFTGLSAAWTADANASSSEAARGAQWYKGASTTFTATGFSRVTKITLGVAKSSSGTGSIKIQENNTVKKTITSFGTSTAEQYYSWGTSPYTGTVKVVVNATKNSLYMKTIVVTFLTEVTLDKNGGAANGTIYFDHNATGKWNSSPYNTFSSALTRSGYTCTGYWTASSGGTKVLNANGSFAAANVSESTTDYISSSKWVYAGATLTLYAQWESAAACAADVAIETASLNGTFL